jgi:hypothetical protein
MVSVPDQRPAVMLSPPMAGRTARRLLLIAAASVILALIVITLVVLRPWYDPNRESADSVVRHAGIPAGVTPGPPQ